MACCWECKADGPCHYSSIIEWTQQEKKPRQQGGLKSPEIMAGFGNDNVSIDSGIIVPSLQMQNTYLKERVRRCGKDFHRMNGVSRGFGENQEAVDERFVTLKRNLSLLKSQSVPEI